ncbi:hypothetical protein GCM10010313_25710 [Streptomyces violarus]|nr:hypothetical protein GCM10010313_25710 [Streptomyces violarus]
MAPPGCATHETPAPFGRADYSAKHRRHGVNVQVVTDPEGRLLWLSPTLPGLAHDLTAASFCYQPRLSRL